MAILLNQGKLDLGKMRGVLELRASGIDLSSSSNEVAKMYDAILFQGFGFFDAPEVNGIQGCLATISELDPQSPLFKTFTVDYGIDNFKEELQKLKTDLRDQNNPSNKIDRKWTQFEKNQIQALIYKLEGNEDSAVDIWSKQIAKNPLDIFSLHHAVIPLIFKGSSTDLYNLAGYVSAAHPRHNLFYPFIRSYEAFGLEERGQLDSALTMAEESIELCPWNSWGAHTVAHVYDSQGRSSQGLNFLDKSRQQWAPCNMLTCHNNWHMAVFNVYNDNIDAALELWDKEVFSRLNEKFSYFLMNDAVSLLSRIEMEQCSRISERNKINLSSRWNKLFDSISHVIDLEDSYNFYDAHLALALMFSDKKDLLNKLCDKAQEWVSKFENKVLKSWDCESTCNQFVVRSQLLIPLIKALNFFKDKDYQSAVNILHPLRHKLQNIGGSKAQNDVFQQILATSLLMAEGEENISFLKMLLFERKGQRVVDDYGERMQRRIVDSH